MDYKTLMRRRADDKQVVEWEREQKNRILSLTSTKKKQTEWNRVFPKMDLAIYGLTEKQLSEIESNVY